MEINLILTSLKSTKTLPTRLNLLLRSLLIHSKELQIKTWAPTLNQCFRTGKTAISHRHREAIYRSVCPKTWAQTSKFKRIKRAAGILSSTRDAISSTRTSRPSQQQFIFTVAALTTASSHTVNSARKLPKMKTIRALAASRPCISHKWCQDRSSFRMQIWIMGQRNLFRLGRCRWCLRRQQSRINTPRLPMDTQIKTCLKASIPVNNKSQKTIKMTLWSKSTKLVIKEASSTTIRAHTMAAPILICVAVLNAWLWKVSDRKCIDPQCTKTSTERRTSLTRPWLK